MVGYTNLGYTSLYGVFNLNEFESKACKVMAVILVILLSLLSFQLMGCTSVIEYYKIVIGRSMKRHTKEIMITIE